MLPAIKVFQSQISLWVWHRVAAFDGGVFLEDKFCYAQEHEWLWVMHIRFQWYKTRIKLSSGQFSFPCGPLGWSPAMIFEAV